MIMHEKTLKRQSEMLATAFGSDIAHYFLDQNIIEIMVNPDGKLWIESLIDGKKFTEIYLSAEQRLNIIKLIAASHQAIVDTNHPELACELPEIGARFQGWLPPITQAVTFTIRKPAVTIFSLDDYIKNKTLSTQHAVILKQALNNKKNILIAGGTGSGKTTFANALLHELRDSHERIIILEDLPELKLISPDVVKLRSCPQKSMRDLVRGSLRMRPDRIIVGEVRDGAALELLKAWNTGHPGGLCTIHANSATAALERLEDLILEVLPAVPKRLITQSIDLVLFMTRAQNNKYQIAELLNL